jgi:hypothetical protein
VEIVASVVTSKWCWMLIADDIWMWIKSLFLRPIGNAVTEAAVLPFSESILHVVM